MQKKQKRCTEVSRGGLKHTSKTSTTRHDQSWMKLSNYALILSSPPGAKIRSICLDETLNELLSSSEKQNDSRRQGPVVPAKATTYMSMWWNSGFGNRVYNMIPSTKSLYDTAVPLICSWNVRDLLTDSWLETGFWKYDSWQVYDLTLNVLKEGKENRCTIETKASCLSINTLMTQFTQTCSVPGYLLQAETGMAPRVQQGHQTLFKVTVACDVGLDQRQLILQDQRHTHLQEEISREAI